jgi:hypothetical protein
MKGIDVSAVCIVPEMIFYQHLDSDLSFWHGGIIDQPRPVFVVRPLGGFWFLVSGLWFLVCGFWLLRRVYIQPRPQTRNERPETRNRREAGLPTPQVVFRHF